MSKQTLIVGQPFCPAKVWKDISILPTWLRNRPRSEVSYGAKVCYSSIIKYIGKNMKGWPSERTLAHDIGCSIRQVRRYTAELRRLQLLQVTNRTTEGKSNEYAVLWHPWCEGGRTTWVAGGRTSRARRGGQVEPTEENKRKEKEKIESEFCEDARTGALSEERAQGGAEVSVVTHAISKNEIPRGLHFPTSEPCDEEIEPADGDDDGVVEDCADGSVACSVPDLEAVVAAAKQKTETKVRRNNSKRLSRAARRAQNAANLRGGAGTPSLRKAVSECQESWLAGVRKLHPDVKFAPWSGKERGQCQQLLREYGQEVVLGGFNYVFSTWTELRARFKVGPVPSLGWLVALRSTLLTEGQKYAKIFAVKKQARDFQAANPGAFLPAHLREAVAAAKVDAQALGLM